MGLRRSLLPGILCATAMLIAAAPASAAVLYDQYNNPATNGAVTSQDFETSMNNFDDQAADDFVVPAGQGWSVTGVDVDGEYTGSGPAASFNVFFYSNTSNLPGAVVATRAGSAFTAGPSAGDAVIALSTPVPLGPGTYWVSVQARQDQNPAGQWFWHNRTVTSNSGGAWQNPGGGIGVGCTAWGRKTTCIPDQIGADQVFRLNGTILPGYTAQTSTGTIEPGTADTGNHGDDVTTPINFPFPVSFYGQNFNNGVVSSNGNLQLSGNSNCFSPTTAPCPRRPRGIDHALLG